MTLRERWEALGKRERYLAVGTIVLALAVCVRVFGVSGVGELSLGDSDETWVQLQRIRNYRRVAGRAEAAKAEHASLVKRYGEAQARLIEGSTATQVGAELQGKLSNMASAAGLNVLSSLLLREEEEGGFRRVGVRLSLSGDLDGMAKLLSSIETGSLDLKVSLLELNRKLGAARRPTPGRPSSRTATNVSPLTATVEVKTFMKAAL